MFDTILQNNQVIYLLRYLILSESFCRSLLSYNPEASKSDQTI